MFNEHEQKTFRAIQSCRTSVLGGHLYKCEKCGTVHLLNNSCRNRNCPICQGEKRVKWVKNQCNKLLNVLYYHVVFTVPAILNRLFLEKPVICYNILYRMAWATLEGFFENENNFGGQGGMICILHSWGQNLSFHPHIHCIVPGAGIDFDGNFKIIKGRNNFLFPVKKLSNVFRAKFTAELTKLEKKQVLKIYSWERRQMFEKKWVVHCKKPFGKPQIVVNYLGNYSHRIAISENRILSYDAENITFNFKNYKKNGEHQTMQLSPDEFFRRFAMHILPHRFVKIRHYGVMSNSILPKFLELGREVVGKFELQQSEYEQFDEQIEDVEFFKQSRNLKICPTCKQRGLRKIGSFSWADIKTGILIVEQNTGEILFRSRDGPIDENTIIKTISLSR